MKPYYQDSAVTIYHGDCREIEVEASVFITDPPYGVNFGGKNTKHTSRRNIGYIGGDNELGPIVISSLVPKLRGAVFCGIRLMFSYPIPQDVGCVYCPSGAGIGPWGFCCFNPILFYGKRTSNVLLPTSKQSFETADDCGHPCPKPIGWLLWLVKLASLKSDTILDPFMGSGTTLRAAKDLGRKAIGIEIEEKYCEIAAKRMAQEVLAL